jgi:hypothetical protein
MKSKIILPLVLTSVTPSAFAGITFTNDIVYDEYIKNNNNIKFILEKTNTQDQQNTKSTQTQIQSSNMFVETKDYNVAVYFDNTNKQQKNKGSKDITKRTTKINKNKEQFVIDKENNVVLVTEQFKQQTGIQTHNNWKLIKGFGNTKLITNKTLSVNDFTKLTEIAPDKYSKNLIKQSPNNQKFQKNRYVSANRKIKQ